MCIRDRCKLLVNPGIKVNSTTSNQVITKITNASCRDQCSIYSKSLQTTTRKSLCRRQKLRHLWANTPCELRFYWLIRVFRRCPISAIFAVSSLTMWITMLITCWLSFTQYVAQSSSAVKENKERNSTKFYKIMAVPVLLYGSETWVTAKKHLSRL